ncbi:HTH-type transcriptional regulator DmlR [Paraburkholderia ultramafica]|uniref:HTH-type transcriptional regulator DmlR n=1 Tax=Paraburkholderia ultramafica TaxID=1544867 RepID=A0A6S7BZI1_9BURK|nr:LysR substrate-binding domain-containing protein [Paraburkholderia ultramafica]CAB3809787.1 HTH-type transcriptional regulator DmlR [Paraburkholderia ultramafica]
MLDLNDLYYFSVVVEKRGFSAAAESIGVPKGTLSKRLRALEQELGLRLANRTTRKFSLTEAGADFHEHCLRVMNEVRNAEQAAQARLSEPVGRVRITCATGIVRMALDDLLPQFMAAHPKIDIDLLTSNRYVDLVEEGYDLALRSHTEPLQTSSLIARPVAQTRVTLVASPTLFPQGLPQRPEDLDCVAGIQLARRDAGSTWLLHAADGRTATVPYRPRMRCNDAPLARRAAAAGIGVAALPSPLCRADIAQGTLVRILPDWHIPRGTLSLVFPSHRGMSPAMRATVDFLVEALPEYLND